MPTSVSLLDFCVELTHGLAYLVFKYQLLLKHRLPLVSETTDYTEANSVVKLTSRLNQLFFQKNLIPVQGELVFSISDNLMSSRVHNLFSTFRIFSIKKAPWIFTSQGTGFFTFKFGSPQCWRSG